jgi:hypothetical protein
MLVLLSKNVLDLVTKSFDIKGLNKSNIFIK